MSDVQQQSDVVEVVSIDEVQTLVNDAIVAYDQRLHESEQNYASSLEGLRADLSGDISGIKGSVDNLAKASADGAKADEVYIVQLDGEQWATLQKCWGWSKAGAQVGLYLALLILLMVCALLGNRLWSAFSKGWRS